MAKHADEKSLNEKRFQFSSIFFSFFSSFQFSIFSFNFLLNFLFFFFLKFLLSIVVGQTTFVMGWHAMERLFLPAPVLQHLRWCFHKVPFHMSATATVKNVGLACTCSTSSRKQLAKKYCYFYLYDMLAHHRVTFIIFVRSL